MSKYRLPNVSLTPKKQNILNGIVSQSAAYAQKLGKPYVTRDMSLLATLNQCPALITDLNHLELDADGIYKSLYFKHMITYTHQKENPDSEVIDNSTDLYNNKIFADGDTEGEEWKKVRDAGKAPAPDLNYQILLYTELSGKGTPRQALLATFLGSIKEMLRNQQQNEQDPRLVSNILDYFCTSYPEGLSYATFKPEVEDKMRELALIDMFGTQVFNHTQNPNGEPTDPEEEKPKSIYDKIRALFVR